MEKREIRTAEDCLQRYSNMAESEGFEPPDGFPSTVFKPANMVLIYKDFFLNHLKILPFTVTLNHVESCLVTFGVSLICPKITRFLRIHINEKLIAHTE